MTKPKFLTTANRAPSDLSLDHLQTADPFPYPWKLPPTPPLRAHVPKCSDVRPSASPASPTPPGSATSSSHPTYSVSTLSTCSGAWALTGV